MATFITACISDELLVARAFVWPIRVSCSNKSRVLLNLLSGDLWFIYTFMSDWCTCRIYHTLYPDDSMYPHFPDMITWLLHSTDPFKCLSGLWCIMMYYSRLWLNDKYRQHKFHTHLSGLRHFPSLNLQVARNMSRRCLHQGLSRQMLAATSQVGIYCNGCMSVSEGREVIHLLVV